MHQYNAHNEANELLQQQYHRHSYRDPQDNLLYYFFQRRKHLPGSHSYADVWRERCPCPRGPRCSLGAQCCFDAREPREFGFGADPQRARDSRRLFRQMRLLFVHREPLGAAHADEEDVCAEIWSRVCPERAPPPPDYEVHPYGLIQTLGLALRLGAGALDELVAPFRDARVRAYFLHWLQLVAMRHPPALPLKTRGADDAALACRRCQERERVQLQLCVAHPAAGQMPACALRCLRCQCRTMISVYV